MTSHTRNFHTVRQKISLMWTFKKVITIRQGASALVVLFVYACISSEFRNKPANASLTVGCEHSQSPSRSPISSALSRGNLSLASPKEAYCVMILRPKFYGTKTRLSSAVTGRLQYGRRQASSQETVPGSKNVKPFKMASVTSTGSWEWTEDFRGPGGYKIDLELADAVSQLVSGTVYDFGAGKGLYSCYINLSHKRNVATAFDGSKNAEDITQGNVHYLDLSTEHSLKPVDWVLCLEVGEHIPPMYEDIFLRNLVRHARIGIILSWDQPEDGKPDSCGGHGHVNCRSEAYVTSQLHQLGFQLSFQKSVELRQSVGRYMWYKDNILVFFRR